MRVLDLFSGIGGFALGLERAGMTTVQFCEIDPYCRKVLNKHWPHVPIHDDIRTLDGTQYRGAVDLVCGGFPCQDISLAGKGAGIDGERSGLWSEYARIIGEVRPRYVIVENVAALLGRGLDRVLRDLAALGCDAEWHCIPASAVGAPHRRDRLWIVAYPISIPEWGRSGWEQASGGRSCDDTERPGYHAVAMADVARLEGRGISERIRASLAATECGRWWATEPDVGRVAHGIPKRVDRLRSLGNSVVPQVVEQIGRAIMEAA